MSSEMRGLVSPEAPKPAGPYSHAVIAGDLVFISGQGPFSVSGQRVGGSFAEQFAITMENLGAIAQSCGGSLHDAVKVSGFLKSMDDFAEMDSLDGQFFGDPLPTRVTVPVDLVGFDVEIDAVLYLPDVAR
jgi:2-iminobutanoate/2-iminopropanoate deaminase